MSVARKTKAKKVWTKGENATRNQLLPLQGEDTYYSRFSKSDQENSKSLLFQALLKSEQVKSLLDLGVPVTITNEDKDTPLLVAVKYNCPLNVIKLLLKSEAVLRMPNMHHVTPLHEAASRNYHQALHEMLNVLQVTETPQIDREKQIRNCRRDQLDKESSCYKIINKTNKKRWSALHYAADNGHVESLHVLLMLGQCDVGMYTQTGCTAFHLAAKRGHLDCLRLLFVAAQCSRLLESLPESDNIGWNLACHASAQGNVEVMKWLLSNMPQHTDVNHTTKKGYTPLLVACEYQKIEIVKLLLDHEQTSEFAAVTNDGKTALHLAAILDSVEIVKLLLDNDLPINQDDTKGETALHVAYKKGNYPTWRLLLDRGADPAKRNKNDKCPEDIQDKDLKIPDEIKKRGDKAVVEYMAALRNGTKKMPRSKLMILGDAGVGKTNLLNLLTGEEFEPKHEETEGVDIELVNTTNIDTTGWKKSDVGGDDDYTDAAASLFNDHFPVASNRVDIPAPPFGNGDVIQQKIDSLVHKYTIKPVPVVMSNPGRPRTQTVEPQQATRSTRQQPVTSHSAIERIAPPETSMDIVSRPVVRQDRGEVVQPPSQSVLNKPRSHSHMPSPVLTSEESVDTSVSVVKPQSVASHKAGHSEIRFLRRVSKKAKSTSSRQQSLALKFTSFDFAGQKHYKPMHHCFITPQAVYVVAFNARHLLSSVESVRCIDSLKFWVNSIRVYTSAGIVLIGTHRGPYPGVSRPGLVKEPFDALTPEEEKQVDNILKKIFDKKDCYVPFQHFKDGKMMALVENSLTFEANSGVDAVQYMLAKLGNALPQKDLPLPYLFLEATIFEKRSRVDSPKALIPRALLRQWAVECHVDDSEEAVDAVLDFFNDIGTIVNPRCLPTLFLTKEDLAPLQEVVLIKPQWLADVMKELMNIDRDADFRDEFTKEENLVALNQLQNKGIADSKLVLRPLWKNYHEGSDEVFQQICLFLEAYGLIIRIKDTQSYFIPCKLPTGDVNIPTVTANCNKIQVKFKDGFLPPFILHHLMFLMYQEIRNSVDAEYHFLESKCFLKYVMDCQWWLCQPIGSNTIDISVRTKSKIRTILPAMQFVDRLLQKIAGGEQLKRISYEVGSIATCSQCRKETEFLYIAYNCKRDNSLHCGGCKNPVEITYNSSEMDEVLKSKNYKYGKPFREFKQDLKYDELDAACKCELVKKFKSDLADKVTADASDDSVVKMWYDLNKDDPWPQVVSHCDDEVVSHCDDELLVDRLKYNFLYLCDHSFGVVDK